MEDVKESHSDTAIDVSSSSGSKDLGKTLPEEAFNNFLQGKRHMLVQDYYSAVQSLATACELYVKHFGELAIECGEVYFLYGKALFRLSQQQAGVLGGALNEGSNEENSSESDKENENENENESEKNSEEGGEEEEGEGEENEGDEGEKEEKEPSESTDSPPTVVDDGSSEVKVKEETAASTTDSADPSVKEESESNVASDQVTESKDDKKEESNEENPEVEEDDLELAWNTLETAKSIFKRKDTPEAQLKVADILLLLAEISMESDNNANAINDLKECLEIQRKHLKPDNRILAETYYQMGLALMLEKMYPDALENFQTTQHILELRKENLKNTPIDEADGTFASADIEVEISDLESILVDIKEKIDDTKELIRDQKKELEEFLVAQAGSSSFSKEKDEKTNSKPKPVSNITHLLKRKKPDEGTPEDSAKRIKTVSVLNGDPKATAAETSNAEG